MKRSLILMLISLASCGKPLQAPVSESKEKKCLPVYKLVEATQEDIDYLVEESAIIVVGRFYPEGKVCCSPSYFGNLVIGEVIEGTCEQKILWFRTAYITPNEQGVASYVEEQESIWFFEFLGTRMQHLSRRNLYCLPVKQIDKVKAAIAKMKARATPNTY
jgi:hypothetical protein